MAKSACCHPTSHCRKAPARPICTVQPVAVASTAPEAVDISLPAVGTAVALAIPQLEDESGIRPPAPRKSPPDLCLLNSVIRI
jgi:hypothetical protein